MDLPTAKERFEIFRQCLQGHDISGLDLQALANADSIDFSGELSFKSRMVFCYQNCSSDREKLL